MSWSRPTCPQCGVWGCDSIDGWSIPMSPQCGVPDHFLTGKARPQRVSWWRPTSPQCGVPDQFLTGMARPQQVGWSRPTSPQCGGNAELRACDGWSIPTSPQCAVFTSDQPSARHDYLVAPHESAMWSGVATELVGRHQLVRNAELWTYDSWSIPTSPQCGVPDQFFTGKARPQRVSWWRPTCPQCGVVGVRFLRRLVNPNESAMRSSGLETRI